MTTIDKDMEALREEYQQCSNHTARVALIGLGLLFLLVITFSRAIEQVNGGEIQQKVTQIYTLADVSGQSEPDMSFVFDLFARPEDKTPRSESEEERQKASAEMRKLASELENSAQIWFTLKPDVLGMSFEADLRYWFVVLPFLFWVMGSYLYIQRRKLALLRQVAAYRLQATETSEATTVDYLFFTSTARGTPPYAGHPAQLEAIVYVALAIGLVVYLFGTTAPFWTTWEADVQRNVIMLIGITTFYFAAYTRHACASIEMQFDALRPRPDKPSLWDRLWNWGTERARSISLVFRSKPRSSLVSGSLLVLMTLFLGTASSCSGEPRKGYELILGWNDANWFTWDSFLGDYSGAMAGRSVYTFSIILAIATIVFVVASTWKPALLQETRFGVFCVASAGAVSVFVLSEFFFISHFSFSFIGDLLRIASWVIPVFLWFRFGLSNRIDLRARWISMRAVIAVMFLPGAVLGCETLYEAVSDGLTGLPVYFAGVHLIAFGYMGLFKR